VKYKLIAIAASGTILTVIALAGAIASRVSGTLAVLVVIALLFGLLHLAHSGSEPLANLLRGRDDTLWIKAWKCGVPGWARWLYRRIPTDPRCRVCLIPFRGVGKMLGIRPSRKNPNFCPG